MHSLNYNKNLTAITNTKYLYTTGSQFFQPTQDNIIYRLIVHKKKENLFSLLANTPKNCSFAFVPRLVILHGTRALKKLALARNLCFHDVYPWKTNQKYCV